MNSAIHTPKLGAPTLPGKIPMYPLPISTQPIKRYTYVYPFWARDLTISCTRTKRPVRDAPMTIFAQSNLAVCHVLIAEVAQHMLGVITEMCCIAWAFSLICCVAVWCNGKHTFGDVLV